MPPRALDRRPSARPRGSGCADSRRPQARHHEADLRLGPLIEFAAYTLRKGGARTEWLTDVVEVSAGETLDLPGSPQIIGMPSHSEGSIAASVAAADAVFVGDVLTTRHVLAGKKGPQPAPFTEEPAQALASRQAIVDTNAKWVLPSHGDPWSSGVADAVAAVEESARRG